MGRKKKQKEEVTPLMIEISPAVPTVDGPRPEAIRDLAMTLARENGLKGEIEAQGPERVDYPVRGHGYVVMMRERDGKQRIATARFDHEGKPTYWTMDGRG